MIVYHGSAKEVKNPDVSFSKNFLDLRTMTLLSEPLPMMMFSKQ